MNLKFLLSIIVFAATLILVLWKPRNIGIGYSALAGALASYLLGIINVADIGIVWGIIWNATFTFVAIIIISLILDEAGVFEYAAIRIARFSRGNGVYLFIMTILLGAGISAVFANDGTALILTPIIYLLLVRAKLDQKAIIPYIMATGFIADSSSMPLIISNLVNIVTAGYFHISFLSYAREMVLPDLASIAASLFFLYLFYRKDIPAAFSTENMKDEKDVIRDRLIFRISLPLIALLMAAYSLGGLYGIPVAFIAGPAAILLMLATRIHGRVDMIKPLREAPWQIVIFSLGMYLVVYGMGREGMTSLLSGLIQSAGWMGVTLHTVFSGFVFAGVAGIMNNMPSVLLGNLALGSFHSSSSLVYANVVGNDIGPKFTPIGSLATLVWLHTLKRKSGITISTLSYMKMGLIVGIPVLFLSLLTISL